MAGYYCDIVTPLQKVAGDYYLTDLFLDYWLAPGQPPMALDEDEFSSAVGQRLLSAEQIERARVTFSRLRDEMAAGIFPGGYIDH